MNRETHLQLDLSSFRPPKYSKSKTAATRALWYTVNAIAFQSTLPILPSFVKAALLRAFGGRVGRGLVVRPGVNIKFPWLLRIGNNVWIGEGVTIDNPAEVEVGSNCCISQQAMIVSGSHCYKVSSFDFRGSPVIIGDRCWLTVRCLILPGAVIAPNTVIGPGEIVGAGTIETRYITDKL